MAAKLVTYIPYSEFNGGHPSSLEEFRRELSKFDRKGVLYICAVLNCLLKLWRAGNVELEVHDLLINSAFPPALVPTLSKMSRDKNSPRFVFHRQQALFVFKEALGHCSVSSGINPLERSYWGGLGKVFLMASDHLHYEGPREDIADARIVQMMADFIAVLEASGWYSLAPKVIRSYVMLHKFAQELKEDSQSVDVCHLFQKSVGISALEYQALTFAALSKYLLMDLGAFKADPKAFLLPRTWFRKTPIAPDHVDRWLELVAATPEDLHANYAKRNAGHSDFTWFRDKPLVHDEGNIYAIDPAFLAEKIETGVFWSVFSALDNDGTPEKLHAFWGKVFERYANALLQSAVDGSKNIFLTRPAFQGSGDEVCDAVVRCGSSLILIEHKGSTFTARAKYGSDHELLQREIETKLVGTEAARKGVRQLASAIERLFILGHKLEGMDLSKVTKIIPVLVTRDDIGGTLLMNLYLQRRFRTVFAGSVKPRILTPLFCLSAEALEVIASYLKEVRFDEILEARYRAEPKLMSTFLAVDNSALKDKTGQRVALLEDAWKEFTTHVNEAFFPNEKLVFD